MARGELYRQLVEAVHARVQCWLSPYERVLFICCCDGYRRESWSGKCLLRYIGDRYAVAKPVRNKLGGSVAGYLEFFKAERGAADMEMAGTM